jgi:hypothetical protein
MAVSGGEEGFIPNALLIFRYGSKSSNHDSSVNYNNYSKWLKEKLILNLALKYILISDNAPCYNV